MLCLWHHGQEVEPSVVVNEERLWVALLATDDVGPVERVTVLPESERPVSIRRRKENRKGEMHKEHRVVEADEVVVALARVKLDGEAARVAG